MNPDTGDRSEIYPIGRNAWDVASLPEGFYFHYEGRSELHHLPRLPAIYRDVTTQTEVPLHQANAEVEGEPGWEEVEAEPSDEGASDTGFADAVFIERPGRDTAGTSRQDAAFENPPATRVQTAIHNPGTPIGPPAHQGRAAPVESEPTTDGDWVTFWPPRSARDNLRHWRRPSIINVLPRLPEYCQEGSRGCQSLWLRLLPDDVARRPRHAHSGHQHRSDHRHRHHHRHSHSHSHSLRATEAGPSHQYVPEPRPADPQGSSRIRSLDTRSDEENTVRLQAIRRARNMAVDAINRLSDRQDRLELWDALLYVARYVAGWEERLTLYKELIDDAERREEEYQSKRKDSGKALPSGVSDLTSILGLRSWSERFAKCYQSVSCLQRKHVIYTRRQ
ncbi:hypothetical protein BU26DRAFT_578397 [Trematosphaeria pertusa]|uniref:Uncharacterized protein n=1 Tax=Trematosphaeria pertusa TaxID=390896 RepID=A0A6A6I7R6_9PLEO|nr:uncharacterized protein BU26DRAFT_578397 [Trematosphaeria pertusa]KAF2245573.1 hypothetical protein BU26DRAFT_578397 [Trematosphaeria pertusa]